MRIVQPKLSPGKGGWSRNKRKAAARRRGIEAGKAYMDALDREAGMHRSQGAASPPSSVTLTEAEKAELMARLARKRL